MKKKTSLDKILNQLSLIEDINKDILVSQELKSPLMVKQYEHLKKQYVKNLFKMLEENYQIPIPTSATASTETKKEAA